jgi:hypothetical protein
MPRMLLCICLESLSDLCNFVNSNEKPGSHRTPGFVFFSGVPLIDYFDDGRGFLVCRGPSQAGEGRIY